MTFTFLSRNKPIGGFCLFHSTYVRKDLPIFNRIPLDFNFLRQLRRTWCGELRSRLSGSGWSLTSGPGTQKRISQSSSLQVRITKLLDICNMIVNCLAFSRERLRSVLSNVLLSTSISWNHFQRKNHFQRYCYLERGWNDSPGQMGND